MQRRREAPIWKSRIEALTEAGYRLVVKDRLGWGKSAGILPHGEVLLIPDVGHNPHEEVPDIVNAELIRFLDTAPAEPAGGKGR